MPSHIDALTPDQVAKFPGWVQQWVDIGLSTEPANFEKSIEAALRGYSLAGLSRPAVILRMPSPYGAVLGGALVVAMLNKQVRSQVESQVGSQVESQVWSQVESQVWSQVRSQVRSQVWSQVESQVSSQVGSQVESQVWSQVASQVWSQVGSQVESQVWSQVESQVWSQVRSQVRSQVWSQVESQVSSQVASQVGSQVESQVWSQVRSQVWSQVRDSIYNSYNGAFWAPWAAYVSFFRDVCHWDDPILERFAIEEILVRHCGWIWWHENVLAVSDRPRVINRDAQGRLHCETGPSMAYRDGWQLFHWHGTSVPEEWIMDRASLTPAIALKQNNLEQRRAACEILGWARILEALDAKMIDRDHDPQIGDLLEVRLPDLERPARFLKVKCGTGRDFVIGVPPHIHKALEAQAWVIGLESKDFLRPEVRA